MGGIVYEVDAAGGDQFKTATLSDLGAEPPPKRRTVAADHATIGPPHSDGGFGSEAVPAAWSRAAGTCRSKLRIRCSDNITALVLR